LATAMKETRMARAERLLGLIQVLRRHRHPVSGQVLADELGVSRSMAKPASATCCGRDLCCRQ
jgi:HTH domain